MTTDGHQPFLDRATLGIICYNQQEYIVEALHSALAQTYATLDIVISDDCSTDETWLRVQSVVDGYRGAHRVRVHRNSENIGLLRNLNRLIELVETRYVILMAGDDVSTPDRVTAIMRCVAADSTLTMVASDIRYMDAKSVLGAVAKSWNGPETIDVRSLSDIASPIVVGCACAYAVEVFRRFPPFNADLITEDGALPFRAALLGNIKYIHRPLVNYRLHAANFSRSIRSMDDPAAGRKNARVLYTNARQRLTDTAYLRDNDIGVAATVVTAMGLALEMEKKLALACNAEKGGIAGIVALMKARSQGYITLRDAIKTVLRANFPRVWFAYVKWRLLSTDKSG